MINIPRGAKIAIAAVLAIGVILIFFAKKDYTKKTQQLDSIVVQVIKDCGVRGENFLYGRQERGKSGGHTFLKITRRYETGPGFSFDKFQSAIGDALQKTNFRPVRFTASKDSKKEEYAAFFSFKDRIVYEISFLKKKRRPIAKAKGKGARIAIVLDDFGYNMNNLDTLYGINTPLTIAVLPNLAYSTRIAEEAGTKKLEVILHLPLEPKSDKEHTESGTITTDMAPKEVRTILANALASVSGAKGVSNHMGSKATEDRDLMKVIFDDLNKRHLYFLDSLTADDSVCAEVAAKSKIRIATRSIFLDNELDDGYIEKQIRRTAELASKTGFAVGIGHDRPATVRVLAKVIPELKNDGFQFVYLSEIVK
ncbi:MAG: divergent polysaccharide deacetylase family protein [Candidatus Omnitrophota bacterium]|nr:divergent polysaccharide deacetylase family protein [Candidatus Omnitrophota bacterium]